MVIPTVNEEASLPGTLACLRGLDPPPLEVIVVDGGSADATARIAARWGARVVEVRPPGRARQLDAGARRATGSILCFLHADTVVPPHAMRTIGRTLEDPTVALAGFTSIMRGERGVQRVTSFHNWIKTYYAPMLYRPFAGLFRGLRLLFGDQVMFCRRGDYLAVGGFDPEAPIMEEADLCLRLNRLGRIRQLSERVYSSDRRVAKWGVLRANLLYLTVALGWGVGYPKERLRMLYEDVR
ncbi:MAG: TIGR04283 family arsenosugar biosynthesis glycosyltransferase [Sandaracinaceae bacterium]